MTTGGTSAVQGDEAQCRPIGERADARDTAMFSEGSSMARNSDRFHFDGGAATHLGTGILGFLITIVTLGFCYPFALVLKERWRAKHSYIDGQRLVFTGSAWGLFGNWVGPRIACWKWEHT